MSTVLQIVLPGARLTGPELLRLGIAHELVDDDQVRARAEALAAEIASFPAGAARRLKQSALRLASDLPVMTATSEWFDRAVALAPTAAPPPRA